MKKVTFLDSDTYFRLKKDLHTFLQFSQRLNSISKKVLVHVRYLKFPAQWNCIFLCYNPYILSIHISILDEQDCILR